MVFGACSFKDVKVIEISFYDGNNLLQKMSQFKYNSEGYEPPKKDGYTFIGWYADKECTTPVEFSSLKSNCSVYAGWEKQAETKYYTITFMNENVLYKTTRASSVSNIDYPAEEPQKSGYVFSGWDGVPSVLDSDVTLYASFKRICRVDFYLDNSSDPYATKTVVEGEQVDLPSEPQKAETKVAYYTFTRWVGNLTDIHGDVKVYAEFEEHKILYNYSFVNYNGKNISQGSGYYQSNYEIPNAEKPADQSFVYFLDGYDINKDGVVDELPETLEFSFTAVAVFSSRPRAYTVTFLSDGVIVDQKSVEYGEGTSSDIIPKKDSDERYDYEFSHWDKDLTEISADTTVNAVYDSSLRSYTYRFLNYEGEVISEVTDTYGEEIVPPSDDEKPSTTQFYYEFKGWNGFTEGMTVSSDIEFSPIFEEHTRTYTYKFIFNNSVYASGELEYGEEIERPDDPSLDGYAFTGWSGFPSSGTMIITSNCEFTAKFKKL